MTTPARTSFSRNRIRIILLLTALLSATAGIVFRTAVQPPPPDERVLLSASAPNRMFRAKDGSPPVYRADDGSVAFNTHDIVPSIRGYAGAIKLLLVVDRVGRITGIRIIEHRETKNYVHYMETPSYLSRFIGKFAGDLFEIDKDIDGISRATVSVKALADTVRESSRIVAVNVLGIPVTRSATAVKSSLTWFWYAGLFCAAFGGYQLTRSSSRFLRLRDLTLVAGVLIAGLYLSSPFSIMHVLNLLLGRPSSSVLWYVIVGTTLLSIVVAGRFYCGWICPFGALSEFLGRLPFRKWEVPIDLDERWRRLKYVLLGLVAAIVLMSGRVDHGNFETYVTLFSFHGTIFAWLLAAVSLAANIRIERFWCRYLCPVAALTGLLARETAGYPSSGACPMANKPGPSQSECIRCNRCFVRTRPDRGSTRD